MGDPHEAPRRLGVGGYRAGRVIFAAPQFVARHVIRPYRDDPPEHLRDFQYGSWLVANVHRAYAELAGRPEGAPLDAVAVFGDMTAMNGGVPVACHA